MNIEIAAGFFDYTRHSIAYLLCSALRRLFLGLVGKLR